MKKRLKRLAALIIVLAMCIGVLSVSATEINASGNIDDACMQSIAKVAATNFDADDLRLFAAKFPDSLYLKQETSYTCTLAATAMMLRAAMYLGGRSDWSSVTESGIKSKAWIEGTGLRGTFTYDINGCSMKVTCKSVSGFSVSSLKSLLDSHPEGIVLYDTGIPHAIFLTDYEGDTFYCADSGYTGRTGKRLALKDSLLGKTYGSQANILSTINKYWYVASKSIVPSEYYLDVNGYLDDQYLGNTNDYATFDVYINGSKVADDVSDYYTVWPTGTSYEITDVKPFSGKYYWGALDGNTSGTIGNETVKVRLRLVSILSSGQVLPNGRYQIATALDTSKVLDVQGYGTDNGTNIHIYNNGSQTNQMFDVIYNPAGYYVFQDVNSGKYMHVQDGKQPSSSNVHLWEGDGINARWILRSAGNGYYHIVQCYGGLYLDVTGGSSDNGTNIQIYTPNGSTAQNFLFIPMTTDISDVSRNTTVISGLEAKTYTGSAITQSLTVTVNGVVLQQGTDYTVTYANNVNAGTATIKVTGAGNYTGSMSNTFEITPKSITPTITQSAYTYYYDGTVKTPAIVVKDGSTTLKANTDYTITLPSGRTNVGTYTIAVTLKGNYSGSGKVTYKIINKSTETVPVEIQEESGWQKVDGTWYYFNTDGVMATGWQKIGGKWYCFSSTGEMQTGWVKSGGKWYYLGTNGVMTTGWQKVSGKWYYLGTNGVMTTGWQKVSGKWYYLGTDGVMTTGWQKVSGKWYYLGTNGVLTTDWQKVSGKWYYLGSDGAMTTGWQKVSGKWYYLGTDGAMTTGWQKVSGKWYYLGTDGAMTTGWQKVSGKWYYMGADGVMTTGWQKIGGKWYYLGTDGVMVTGWQKISGTWYQFDSNGVWVG